MTQNRISPSAAAETIPFQSEKLAAACVPAWGGRLSMLRAITPHGEIDLIVPMLGWTDTPWRWPKAGAYPLLPYSNRIRDGRLTQAQSSIILKPHPDAMPHTLHGPAHLRRWVCVSQTPDSVTLALDYSADEDWPWPFRAEQIFSLHEDTLVLVLRMTNTGTEAFPAGMGWHPYFLSGPRAVLQHDAQTRWRIDDDGIADGESAPVHPPFQRTEYLSGWHRACITPEAGFHLDLTADPLFSHLVCHRPDDDLYACAEPVTHVADAFNLSAQGIAGTGAHLLEPGAVYSGKITLRIRF